MTKFSGIRVFALLSVLLLIPLSAESRTYDLSNLPELVKELTPSVVNISTTKVVQRSPFGFRSPFGRDDQFERFFERFFGDDLPQREFRNRGLGSGFIISEDGYIVTNHHVIRQAEEIEVILQNGEQYDARIVGSDPKTDIALLKIETDQKLQAVKLGDSARLDIGEPVIAIGNPFGLGHTVTSGIVSAKGRSLGLGAYDDFIQIDAAINPGNSGGPLFNFRGEVVGVNTAIIAGGQGIGFAIPVNMASQIVNQLRSDGKVVRGWLGVIVQQITPEIAASLDLDDHNGALVSDIAPGGPADKAGLRRGDVIVRIDDRQIKDMPDLPRTVADYTPGEEAVLSVLRHGQKMQLNVVLGQMPDDEQVPGQRQTRTEVEQTIGLVVEQITPQIKNRYSLPVSEGVIVIRVADGTLADQAGFRTGDIILEMNGKKIKSVSDYNRVISEVKGESNLLFLVQRGERTLFIAMKYTD